MNRAETPITEPKQAPSPPVLRFHQYMKNKYFYHEAMYAYKPPGCEERTFAPERQAAHSLARKSVRMNPH